VTEAREENFGDGRPAWRRRWPAVVANVVLVIAILALLAATWMPAIYDRIAATKPVL
jgi:hypothetical protein